MHDLAGPNVKHPITRTDGSSHKGTVFLAAVINHPRIRVGAYTYASAHTAPNDWAAHLAPYLYDFSPEQLTIGKFCQIANGVQLVTASANHRYDGISSCPFAIFGGGPKDGRPSLPTSGLDTTIGNDCWIGTDATLLPGTTLGNGVIVGAGAVVSGSIPDYAIVVGNPARVVKMRFDQAEITIVKAIAWWDWSITINLKHEAEISGADFDALQAV